MSSKDGKLDINPDLVRRITETGEQLKIQSEMIKYLEDGNIKGFEQMKKELMYNTARKFAVTGEMETFLDTLKFQSEQMIEEAKDVETKQELKKRTQKSRVNIRNYSKTIITLSQK